MTAYAIFIREGEIIDADEMDKYRMANRSATPSVPVKPLVVYGRMEALEGEAPDGMVMLQFESMDDALKGYNDPLYQAASKHRKNAAKYRAFLVEGFTPPA